MSRSATVRARRALVVPGVLLVALLGACGGGDEQVAQGIAPSASAPAGSTGEPTDPAADPTGTATPTDVVTDGGDPGVPTASDDVVVEGLDGATRTATLAEMRAGAHEGYDRVVLEFDGPLSGYVVRYVDSLTSDPEGSPVEHGGSAVIQVIAQGATLDTSFQLEADEAPRRYLGPAVLTADLTSVKDVVQAGDFEATLSLGIGVSGTKAFEVQYLEDPTRIVVDVAH